MKLHALVLSATLLVSCAGFKPGEMNKIPNDPNNPIITIGAGKVPLDSADTYEPAWYVIDTKVQVCWMMIRNHVSSLDCCRLLRVEQARPNLPWLSEGLCQASPPKP